MPTKIRQVFALDKNDSKGKGRFNLLCSFKYSQEHLAAAEQIVIGEPEDVGGVDDSEYVARVLEDPSHVTMGEHGLAYTPGAFGDCSKWGLSVQRMKLTSDEEIQAFGTAKANAASRTYRGYAVGKVAVLREKISEENQSRLFGVFATPLPGVPSHADVYSLSSNRLDKEKLKADLWEVFNLDSHFPAPIA